MYADLLIATFICAFQPVKAIDSLRLFNQHKSGLLKSNVFCARVIVNVNLNIVILLLLLLLLLLIAQCACRGGTHTLVISNDNGQVSG